MDKDDSGRISLPTDQEILAGLSNRSSLETESAPVTANLQDCSREPTQELNRNLLLEMRQATAAIVGLMKNFMPSSGQEFDNSFSIDENWQPGKNNKRSAPQDSFEFDKISLCAGSQSSLVQDNSVLEVRPSTFSEVCPSANKRPMPENALSDIDILALFEVSAKNDKPNHIDMETEILDFVDNKTPLQDEESDPISEKLGKKVELNWQAHKNKQILSGVTKKYFRPNNLKQLRVPAMPQQILSMPSFTQNHKVIERKLFNMQLSLSKATGIISQVADKLIQAEKSNTMPDSKDLVLKSLDAIILMGHCNAEVISRRKSNVNQL